jgi:sulfide:quinone oxidoreductase
MKLRVTVLGAEFGGLELTSILSKALGDQQLDLTLIDQNDSFVFGASKLDVMFGRKLPDSVRIPYGHINKPGVRFCQEKITSIDAHTRRVTTDQGSYDADILVIALGADYDMNATPGLSEGGDEFYSFAGVEKLRGVIPTFSKGNIVIGVTSTPYKCPPAPSEAALLMHDYLTRHNVCDDCTISLIMPFDMPIPPTPESPEGLIHEFKQRGINYIPERLVRALDPARRMVILDDDSELPYDLFLGVPKHCAPKVVVDAGLTEDGWIPVYRATLKTRFPGIYAVGDVTSVGTSKAGDFAEGAARVAAASILSDLNGTPPPEPFKGTGTCYIDFGNDRVGRMDVDFFSGPSPTGSYSKPEDAFAGEKLYAGTTRLARWFDLVEEK